MPKKIVGEAITFDDVLILPAKSAVIPSQVNTATRLTRRIELKIPLLSAAMDTVTESKLAISLAQEGGLGIIHKNLSPDAQCEMVEIVKRSANGVIKDPVTLSPKATVAEARELMQTLHISGMPVVDKGKVVGIITNRDLRFEYKKSVPVKDVMTTELITAAPGTSLKKAKDILYRNKVEKLILLDRQKRLQGLITLKDIHRSQEFPNACKDKQGRLRVGAAIGAVDHERAEAICATNVDVIVVDTAHGHSVKVLEMVRHLKKRKSRTYDVIAGNVATAEGAKALIEAGVDAVKVGIGPGSICTTRIVTGVGVPQITAILNAISACKQKQIPVIADGGIRYSGDIAKALVAGANCVMLGSIFAGTTESPGEEILVGGRTYKACRGMGSLGAMQLGSKDRYSQGDVEAAKLVPEGIEGRVPFKGPLNQVVHQLVGGVKATMHYVGAETIPDLQRRGQFVMCSSSAGRESHPHDVTITKEAPNYSISSQG